MKESPGQITIRELDESILQGYKQLHLRALKEEDKVFTTSWEDLDEKNDIFWRDRMQAPHVCIFCAEKENEVLATCGCVFERRLKNRHKAKMFGLYVAPEFRGQGIGRLMIDKTLTWAFKKPWIEAVKLTVTAGNEAAIGLYKAVGFKKWAEEPAALKIGMNYYSKVFLEINRDDWYLHK